MLIIPTSGNKCIPYPQVIRELITQTVQ